MVVDDEMTTRNLCKDVASDAGLHVHAAGTTEHALEILDQYPVDIAVTDLQVPEIGGLELIKRIREYNPEIAIIVLTQYGTIATAIDATKLERDLGWRAERGSEPLGWLGRIFRQGCGHA